MEFYRKENSFLILLFALFFLSAVVFELKFQQFISKKFLVLNNQTISLKKTPLLHVYEPPKKLDNPPEIVKAVYVTRYSAGTKGYLNYLSNIFTITDINAVVVDIKDYSGKISYKSGAILDIDALVRFFHDKNIYVIGRISVFEDPAFAKARPELAIYDKLNNTLWRDNNGLSWLDPASKDAWDYNISLAKDVFYHGFDEVNFDYVRFPSDGKTENMGFPIWDEKRPKAEVIKEFFEYLRQRLPGEKISIDLFGQTTTSADDMGIGQVIENAFENFDFVSPMVYPSHYVSGFMGFANPAEHPYEIINYSMHIALSRKNTSAKIRPWLQDFDMGADYNADMVKAEIKATQDALGEDYVGYMLWNSSNIYTQNAVWKTLLK